MQKGRFAQEFLAELMREPRAQRLATLADRARWLRSLKIGGREELLFELELLLRALELTFDHRGQVADGRALLGRDFADELRGVRDALHRASTIARKLTAPAVEQNYQFRTYMERQGGEEGRRRRLAYDLMDQGTADDALMLLRRGLRALHGVADQVSKASFVTYQAFADFAVVGEQILLSNKFFRPPGALEFRAEYDRVGSVRLLELVKRLGDGRARKSFALGFLACFRLLRYLRYIPAPPTAPPRRALLIAALVRDEARSVANFLAVDVPRLCSQAAESDLVAAAAGNAAETLRTCVDAAAVELAAHPIDRDALERVRESLSEGAKVAASTLARAVEPQSNASEIFDGQRARRERAERLRRDLWVLGRLLRTALESLFSAVKGEVPQATDVVAAIVRFARSFRQMGYFLLRAGDHEPFDRFFGALEALTNAAPSTARDRHLYLEIRKFLPIVDRGLAMVSRRAELAETPIDLPAFEEELNRFQAASGLFAGIDTPLSIPAASTDAPEAALAGEPTREPAGWLAPDEENADDAIIEDDPSFSPPPSPPEDDAESALASEPGVVAEPDFAEELQAEADDDVLETPAARPPPPPGGEEREEEPEPFDPEMTRRIWRTE